MHLKHPEKGQRHAFQLVRPQQSKHGEGNDRNGPSARAHETNRKGGSDVEKKINQADNLTKRSARRGAGRQGLAYLSFDQGDRHRAFRTQSFKKNNRR